MGRGLGTKQQEMLSWLQEQWAKDVQPNRDELMGAFVMDKPGRFIWNRDKSRELQRQYEAEGIKPFDARVKAEQEARNHPDGPELTPRPIAEAYRRALRTLIDRELVKVVADQRSYYRYCDPQADNPLAVVMNRSWKEREHLGGLKFVITTHEAGSTFVGKECGRRREPKISRSEERRQAILKALPADGSWMDIADMARACWTTLDLGEMPPGFLSNDKRNHSVNDWERRWLRPQLLHLQKTAKVEIGTIPWNGTEIEPKRFKEQEVVAARLSVA